MNGQAQISAIIVDDDKGAIESLQFDIEKYCKEIKVVSSATSVDDAFKAITFYKPQLVFLDIDLGKNNSFELLDLFTSISFKIIFVTGHHDFAIKAIKYTALDYLLKPVHDIELIQTIEKVKQTIQDKESIASLKSQIANKKLSSSIAINVGNAIEFVELDNICYFMANNNLTIVTCTNGHEYVISKSVKEFEDYLSERGFFRSHKSYLINVNQVKKIPLKETGKIIMKNNSEVLLSQRKKQAFIEYMETSFNKF